MKDRPSEETITCPGCEKPVPGRPDSCRHCGQALLHTCSCGASWHLANLKCPKCGEEHSFRRRVSRPFFARRKVRVIGVVLLLLLLVGVNVVLIVSQSPRRKKHQTLMEGYAAFGRGDDQTAILRLRKYVGMEPGRADAWFMLGQALKRAGDIDGAIDAWLEATRLRPEFTLAHVALSNVYRARHMPREALRSARIAVANQPVPAEAFVAQGLALLALRNPEGAIRAFREACRRNPRDVDTLLLLGDLYSHRERMGLEDTDRELAKPRYQGARRMATEILERSPDRTRARLWLARALAGLELYDLAAGEAETLTKAEPDVPDHRLLLAGILLAQGKPSPAAKVLRSAWKETPSPRVALDLAHVLSDRLDRRDAALGALEEAIETYPDDTSLAITLVARLEYEGRTEEAQRRMDAALSRFSGDTSVMEASGDLALEGGEPEVASRAYRESLRLRAQNLSARRKLVALLLPKAFEELRIGEGASASAEEVRDHIEFFLDPVAGLNPEDLLALSWKARLAFAEGEYESASEILGGIEKAGAIKTYEGLRILGLSRLHGNDYAGAASSLIRALEHGDCPHSIDDYELAFSSAFRAGQVTHQVQVCWGALERWPGNVVWRLRLAGALLRSDRHRDALRECTKAKEQVAGTTNVKPWLLTARVHQAMGDNDAARRELEDAVAIRRDTETRGALYAFFAATGENRLAEAGFESLLSERPEDADVAVRYGDFLLSRSRRPGLSPARAAILRKDALEQFEKALDLDSGSRAARRRVAELRMSEAAGEEAAIAAAEAAVRAISDTEDPHILYFEGKVQILKGEFEAACQSLGDYVRQTPGDSAGYYYYGIALRRHGEYEKAKTQFRAALQVDPELVEARLELATLLFGEGMRARWHGDFQGARSAFESIVGIDPNEPVTRRFLAEAYARLGMSDEALESAEKVLEVAPDDPGALFISGLVLARKGEMNRAVERFTKLTELDPESPWGHLYLGMALADAGEHDRARDHLRQAYEDKVGRESDDVLRAIALNEVAAGNAAEVVHLVERERDRDRTRAPVHRLLGWLYLELDREEDAVAAYRAAFAVDTEDAVSLALAAAVLADEGRLDEAIALLDDGAARAVNPARLLYLKGRMLARGGKTGEAVTALRQALLADPELVGAYRELGLLLVADGIAVEGEEVLLQGNKRGLSDPEVEFRLAVLAAERDDRESAIRRYRNVLQALPDEIAALNNLSLLLAEGGQDLAEAVRFARRAKELSPGDPRVTDTLGWVLYLGEQHDEAVPLLLEAAAALAESPMVLFHAGMACYRNYRWKDAMRLLEASLQLAPRHAGHAEARQALREMK